MSALLGIFLNLVAALFVAGGVMLAFHVAWQFGPWASYVAGIVGLVWLAVCAFAANALWMLLTE